MDHSSFDRIARLLGGATTRRAGLRAALAGALGIALADPADAAKNASTGVGDGGGASHGRTRGRDRVKPEGPCGDGSRKENACTKHKQCCTGICNMKAGKKNLDGKGRCRCIKRGGRCSTDTNCCSGLPCTDLVCGGPLPVPGKTCATTADCGTGMSCSSGTCFDITPCPAPFSAGSWGIFDVAHNQENDGEGFYPGTLDQPEQMVMLPDGSAFLLVEEQRNRIQKFDSFTFEVLAVMSAPTDAGKIPPAGSGDGEFDGPQGIMMSPNGSEAYVFDNGNSRITVIDPVAWTVIRQVPIDSAILPAGLSLEQGSFSGAGYDPVGNRVLFLTREESQPATIAGIGIVPLNGSTQSLQTLPANEYASFAVSPDGSRLYLGGWGAVAILDSSTFQQVGIRGAWVTNRDDGNCRTGFNEVAYHTGAMGVDSEGRLWVFDTGCKLLTQWDVSNDQFSLVTWIGGSDESQFLAPLTRTDSTLLVFNRDSDENNMVIVCRNTKVPNGQEWRSAGISRPGRHRRA
jgi:DNA-binding beta-propeller fold protein YncE